MCSQTMMSSVETLQGFKVTKAFFFLSPAAPVELCIRGWEGSSSQAHRRRSLMGGGEDVKRKINAQTEKKCRSRSLYVSVRHTHVY